MTGIDHLVEQHILEHESRLKHIDELLERAEKAVGDEAERGQLSAELTVLKRDREELSGLIEKIKQDPAEYWQKKAFEKAGPMGMWDAVAQRLEKLLKRAVPPR